MNPARPQFKAPRLAFRQYIQWELRRSYRRGLIELTPGLLSWARVTEYDEMRRRANLGSATRLPDELPPAPVWSEEA